MYSHILARRKERERGKNHMCRSPSPSPLFSIVHKTCMHQMCCCRRRQYNIYFLFHFTFDHFNGSKNGNTFLRSNVSMAYNDYDKFSSVRKKQKNKNWIMQYGCRRGVRSNFVIFFFRPFEFREINCRAHQSKDSILYSRSNSNSGLTGFCAHLYHHWCFVQLCAFVTVEL